MNYHYFYEPLQGRELRCEEGVAKSRCQFLLYSRLIIHNRICYFSLTFLLGRCHTLEVQQGRKVPLHDYRVHGFCDRGRDEGDCYDHPRRK